MHRQRDLFGGVLFLLVALSTVLPSDAGTRTWDGKFDTSEIEVTVVYFVPSDREPLPDWLDRVSYFCRRMEWFHEREFEGQSKLATTLHTEPFISSLTTQALRVGDANAIYFRTLQEVDEALKFAREPSKSFRILLVLSDINWRPLDDFYRLKPEGGDLLFEGNLSAGEHFPGAASGGARAAYLNDRGVGWGLVSGDGWRVPYRGSDCVIYHEGCGHTVGLPHPEPGDGSVMSMAQYKGWINESWIDKEQKSRLGWSPTDSNAVVEANQKSLFTRFRALPEPISPKPNQEVKLRFDWPEHADVTSLRVRIQTAIDGPWIDVGSVHSQVPLDGTPAGLPPSEILIGAFDRETPVSYRVDTTLRSGESTELWGYFQVRKNQENNPLPRKLSADLDLVENHLQPITNRLRSTGEPVDLLKSIDLANDWTSGKWILSDGVLESPKQYGAKLELPYAPSGSYRLTMIIEPLDEPNALVVGNCIGNRRFVTLFGYKQGDAYLSAIEDIDGRNVGNETTYEGPLFHKDQMSQVVVQVAKDGVQMSVDGDTIVRWSGEPTRLSLSDYWASPDANSLILGTYDCRIRFHRVTLETLSD